MLGKTTIAQGSPFVRFTAEPRRRPRPDVAVQRRRPLDATAGETTYGLWSPTATSAGPTIRSRPGRLRHLVRGARRRVRRGKLAELAANPVTGRPGRYSLDGDTVDHHAHLRTPTVATAFAVMPHQKAGLAAGTTCDLGTYPSVYGTLSVCRGQRARRGARRSDPTTALDVGRLSDADKGELAEQVSKDIADTKPFPADTYFGGKALYRAAMLYQLATQLELEDRPRRSVQGDARRAARPVDRAAGLREARRPSASSTTSRARASSG